MNFLFSKAKQLLSTCLSRKDELTQASRREITVLIKNDRVDAKVKLRKNNIWSGKECALLIAALEDVYAGKISRNEAISVLSLKLRAIGKENGGLYTIYIEMKQE